jgi:ribonuclease J
MLNKIKLAAQLGYLNIPEGMLIDQHQLMSVPSKYVAVLTTGSQGEKQSPLPQMASKLHQRHRIQKGDVVVLSARIIPERKAMVAQMVDNLLHCGAEVIHEDNAFVHVSGHGSQEELKVMLKLVRPKFFMPIHGEERNLISHARLAEQVGIPHENIALVENGNRILLNDEKFVIADNISAGQVFVDEKMDIVPRESVLQCSKVVVI